jgi:hypothetical protein
MQLFGALQSVRSDGKDAMTEPEQEVVAWLTRSLLGVLHLPVVKDCPLNWIDQRDAAAFIVILRVDIKLSLLTSR